MITKKAFATGALTISLGFAVWTLAVSFNPISSNFQSGDEVSSSEFNQLFADIDANFNAASSALDEKVDAAGDTMSGRLAIAGDTGAPDFLGDGSNAALDAQNTNPDGIGAYIQVNSTGSALHVKNASGPLITATNGGTSGLQVANDGSLEIANEDDTAITLDSASGDITLAGAVKNPDGNMLTPIAYGVIDDGATLSGTGNFSVTRESVGRCSIAINGESYRFDEYATVATPITKGFVRTSSSGGSLLLVELHNENGVAQDGTFSFLTFKP